MILGLLVIVAGLFFPGWVAATALETGGGLTGNAGTILQLAGTLSIIVGIVLLAIGFFKFVRRVERHIAPQSR
jgi:membrane protein implicated in regulation of membrane protease activity